MSDRILLLNGGVIEQQGTPTEMYGQPQTYFVADFMGSNNIMKGRIGDIRGGEARIDLDNGMSIWGLRRTNAAIGHEAKAVVRVEQMQVAEAAGDNRAEAELVTSMFLGDRFEYVFHAGKDLLRAWGKGHEPAGRRWLGFPPDAVWIF